MTPFRKIALGTTALAAIFGAVALLWPPQAPDGTVDANLDRIDPKAVQAESQQEAAPSPDTAVRPPVEGAPEQPHVGRAGGDVVTGDLGSRPREETVAGPSAPSARTPEVEPDRETALDAGSVIEAPKLEVVEKAPLPDQGEQGNVAPSFDVVRIDPAGNAVLAGRAAPNADVEVKVGDHVLDRVTANNRGEWVSIPTTPLAEGDQEISLEAAAAGSPRNPSRQMLVVSIPKRDQAGKEAEAAQPVAVVMEKDEGGKGRVLQAPDQIASSEGQLTLKMIDYDHSGATRLSGEAPPGVPIRIYIDNQPASVVIGDANGYWIATLSHTLPPGDYTLRLDQLDTSGQPVARLETPMTRVSAPPVAGGSKVDRVVVQPGNSLWRIARRLSGEGFNYLLIFEANRAQIKNPDVIYPGQVFDVPSLAEVNSAG